MNGNVGDRDWLELARTVLDIEVQGLEAVRGQLGEGFLRALERMSGCRGRVITCGVGKSGLVARKIAATLSSTGTPSFFLHPVEGAHGDLGMIRPEDVVLAISNSGETDELNALLPALRTMGAAIVALTGRGSSTLAELADITIRAEVPREACPMGLAPTASTTAALAVGDALAVCLMEMNGFDKRDFQRMHPGGALGQRLSLLVEALMHSEDLPVARDSSDLAAALDILNRGGLGLVAVVDGPGRLVGVLSDGDVRRLVCRGPFDAGRPVTEFMTRSPRCVRSGETAAQVLDLMEINQITVLPVVREDGGLAGMIHLHDLLGKGRLRFAARSAAPEGR
ncbi:MAG: KpsF/GutQ family sugar-phosphate isomerase [Desulfovibrionaceae bacterium]|nr:KpsF/GutQ family sugar-phosphate isomerase [Desulfovibrionaceae bacterium]